MIRELARRYIFWFADFCKGQPIGKHYRDIKKIFEDEKYAKNRTRKNIADLLYHASTTVEHYKPYAGAKELADFPVLSKLKVKEHPELFISEKYANKELHTMKTSGSTGLPLTIAQNSNKRNRVLAELIYFGHLCGFKIGMKNIYFRLWTEDQKKSLLTALMQNMVRVRIVNLDKSNLDKMRNILHNNKNIKCIMGYASTLKLMSKYMLEQGDSPNMFQVESIISMAEKLSDSTKKDLQTLFNCNVVSRYSNMENGVLAQECPNENEFHLNHASYVFELLKLDSDEPADVGELGRIVITDLFNYAMPLIRYDTGDLGIKSESSKCDLKSPVFRSIDGRQVDMMYDTKDSPISPLCEFGLDEFCKLKQYQVVQIGKGDYILNVNGAEGVYSEESLSEAMKKTLGSDAKIAVVHHNEIPHLSSGKFKQNICKYKPD